MDPENSLESVQQDQECSWSHALVSDNEQEAASNQAVEDWQSQQENI